MHKNNIKLYLRKRKINRARVARRGFLEELEVELDLKGWMRFGWGSIWRQNKCDIVERRGRVCTDRKNCVRMEWGLRLNELPDKLEGRSTWVFILISAQTEWGTSRFQCACGALTVASYPFWNPLTREVHSRICSNQGFELPKEIKEKVWCTKGNTLTMANTVTKSMLDLNYGPFLMFVFPWETKKPMTLILGPRHSRGRSLHVELSKSKRDRRVRQRVVTNLEKEENEGQELQEFPVWAELVQKLK